jgi:hypothetical protein
MLEWNSPEYVQCEVFCVNGDEPSGYMTGRYAEQVIDNTWRGLWLVSEQWRALVNKIMKLSVLH